MSKIKILNDPIYGLVSFPFEFIYDLIDHPYFQRLRRIQQLGMSSIVYPGATHSRFHHALGALHLCDRLINNLMVKGVGITEEEHEASLIAVLLHDIGHGPYSHALEHELIGVSHEVITLHIMNRLNDQYNGRLSLAIEIFTRKYYKSFLSQIISSQLDVDRMDYLNRDSFYTGVAEGIIGYDRIIKMMNVCDNQLVVEEKGLYSVEKFLLSRHFMYQQVYLHKAALSADHMLKLFFTKYKEYIANQEEHALSILDRLIHPTFNIHIEDQLSLFLQIDDADLIVLIKKFLYHEDIPMRILSNGIINRRLFGISAKDKPFAQNEINQIVRLGCKNTNIPDALFRSLVSMSQESINLYNQQDEIKILKKNSSSFVTFDKTSRLNLYLGYSEMHFITYPKEDISDLL